jgi:hypothetical protein
MPEQRDEGDNLSGRAAIAIHLFGADTPKNRRRVTALLREVPVADRIPFFLLGGKPTTRRSWLDEYARARQQNPVVTHEQNSAAQTPQP